MTEGTRTDTEKQPEWNQENTKHEGLNMKEKKIIVDPPTVWGPGIESSEIPDPLSCFLWC